MKSVQKIAFFVAVTVLFCAFFTQEANALISRGGAASQLNGTSSLGFGFAYTGSSQDDLNSAIDDANTGTAGGISTKDFGGTYELFANWIYRFDRSDYALVVRPSYVWASTTGSGASGSYDYKLSGFTIFPMFRIYPLENTFIHFFMQAGLGYGTLNGDITAGPASLKFKGSAFGAVGGIGADFCFTDVHCLTIEGNLRYLPIERNLSTGGTCSASNPIPGLSQCGDSAEVERNGKDLGTTLSGVQGILAYTMMF
jgi:hypothetical protein